VAELGTELSRLPDSLVLLTGGRLYVKSTAALQVMLRVGGFWRLLARLLGLVPAALRDHAYDWFARHRYRLFGRRDSCEIPDPTTRPRFFWD
jgi:predicted DCC family thiol-disulfide oxidoreductase YuxK